MPENKTKPTSANVTAFLKKIKEAKLRDDCAAMIEMMRSVSKSEPVMWGSSIIGFGSRHYVYESGREGDTVIIGFAPRKQNIAVYLTGGIANVTDELSKLGKHDTGKGCLYIKSLEDVNETVLRKIFAKAYKAGQSAGPKTK